MAYDVFISYHGGNGDDNRSSLKKAGDLESFLKENGINCFLYKNTNINDFYDAISGALKECKHFILVACDLEMLQKSKWVEREIKTFDTYCLNNEKKDYIISAYVFGSLTEKDLYHYNSVFATKEITSGERGFNRLLQMIKEKDNCKGNIGTSEHSADNKFKTFSDISRCFLRDGLKKYELLSDEEFLSHCHKLTARLKCMSKAAINNECENFIEDLFSRILQCTTRKLYRIKGDSGTQKSCILRLLYIYLMRNYNKHNYEPVYLNCNDIREDCDKHGADPSRQILEMFDSVNTEVGRVPLFIFDGILSVDLNDNELDCTLQQLIDSRSNSHLIIGINEVLVYDPGLNKTSKLIGGTYDNNLNLSPVSLYDKKKCIDYINTLEDLPISDPEEIYDILHSIGLITIDEEIVRIVCDYHNESNSNIFDIFSSKIKDKFFGKTADMNLGAEYIYKFAFCSEINTTDPVAYNALKIACEEPIYLNCFIAIHYLNKLDEYSRTKDISFFNLIYPKEITRFITAGIRSHPNYEEILLDLGSRYNEMKPHGQSEMSFYLGRMHSPNNRIDAVELLNKYYVETKRNIDEKMIGNKYYNKPYSYEDYIQDLFLLRGLSVSLIYCDERQGKNVMIEYLRSLIDNDTSNMINRGFHLEYYGDKRYNPKRNMLDYRDNLKVGERTLRILCNTVESQLAESKYHPAFLLELFTIVSLLQVRLETNKQEISFNLNVYVKKCLDLVKTSIEKYKIEDNVISAFFKMAADDFNNCLNNPNERYYPQRAVCNEFLHAKDVKRAGWVMQRIDGPESIVEHMYSCWFIGLVMLPDVSLSIEGYDKQKILKMLLVHDLAETRLSDIPKYEKPKYPEYDRIENEVMLSLLLKGTYKEMDNLSAYVDAWDEWYKMSTENARIAKDIDNLQAVYQFLVYNNETPEKFDEERRERWIKEINIIQTDIGRSIVKILISDNPEFRETLNKYKNLLEYH